MSWPAACFVALLRLIAGITGPLFGSWGQSLQEGCYFAASAMLTLKGSCLNPVCNADCK